MEKEDQIEEKIRDSNRCTNSLVQNSYYEIVEELSCNLNDYIDIDYNLKRCFEAEKKKKYSCLKSSFLKDKIKLEDSKLIFDLKNFISNYKYKHIKTKYFSYRLIRNRLYDKENIDKTMTYLNQIIDF